MNNCLEIMTGKADNAKSMFHRRFFIFLVAALAFLAANHCPIEEALALPCSESSSDDGSTTEECCSDVSLASQNNEVRAEQATIVLAVRIVAAISLDACSQLSISYPLPEPDPGATLFRMTHALVHSPNAPPIA
jgi:hypothetical protein